MGMVIHAGEVLGVLIELVVVKWKACSWRTKRRVSTHLSTGYWYVDMALVTLATVVFTSILSALSNPSSAIEV